MALYAGQDLLPVYLLERQDEDVLASVLRSASIEFSQITLDHVPSLVAQPDPAIILIDMTLDDESLETLSYKYGVGCGNRLLAPVALIRGDAEDEQQSLIQKAFRFELGDFILASAGRMALVQRLHFISRQHSTLQDVQADYVETDDLVMDPVTSLPNWRMISGRLNGLLDPFDPDNSSARSSHVVILLNIKRFKRLTAAYGPVECDRLLGDVAARIRYEIGVFVGDDMHGHHPVACRLQADEFVILAPFVEKVEDCLPLAELIVGAFRNPFQMMGEEVRLTPMVGIAVGPEHGSTANAILKATHAAVLEVREKGKGPINIYATGGAENRADMFALESRIRLALRKGEIKVYYQPQVCLKTDRITGMEALIRWHHPEDGVIFPDQFLPQVDEAGLNPDLDEYVLGKAVSEIASWDNEELKGLKLSVNMTPQTFETRDVSAVVAEVLSENGVDPHRLTLEITESTLMSEADLVKSTMEKLQREGVTIALDDFGVGYSSLSYLKDLNFDYLKIDKGFTFGLLQNRQDSAMVQAMINMGMTLGMEIVVEGVEEARQLDWLQNEGAASWQGYLCSRPLIGPDFIKFVTSGEYVARQLRLVV